MKIVGLIAEYNPFHNGHQYHIERAKEVAETDYVIVVMSGNYVQRGMPAIMPKRMRCQAALEAGASLVLELPVCYSTGSAEYFAYGAVSLLDKLGCVDSICFGSECGSIDVMESVASILNEEPIEYKQYLQDYLKQGLSYPLARQKAIHDYMKSDIADSIMSEPNNILGIEYIKALYKLESKMKPCTITRVSSNYHDHVLNDGFSSATAIRNEINITGTSSLSGQIPDTELKLLIQNYQKCYPIVPNDFSLLLKYRLLKETKESLCKYLDVSEELANRIINQRNQFQSFEQFCDLLKTKEITYSRVSRSLLHILLEIKNEDAKEIDYAHVLGFRKEHSEVLSAIKKYASVPLLTKLVGEKYPMLKQDIYASDLYESVVADKFQTNFINEYEQSLVLI